MNTIKRGQVATEYMLLAGIAMMVIIPLFYYAITTSSQNIKMNEANDMVVTLAETADMVYSLGPGSQDYVTIYIPGGAESISFDGNQVALKLKIFGGTSDIFAVSRTNLTGSISLVSGSKHVYVKALENGTVEFGEY